MKYFYRLGVDGTDFNAYELSCAVNEVGIHFVLFTADTIRALIFTGVDEAFVEKILQELLNVVFVASFGSANEIIIGDVDGI
jgi:hypothetical protein